MRMRTVTLCTDILLYGTEAFMLNKSELLSLDVVINRLFMKLFRTNNIETVEFCQDQFGFDNPSVLWARRVRNFDSISSLRRKMPFVS